MDPADVIAMMLAYSSRRCGELQAEAFVSEQRYRETLISARGYKLHSEKLKALSTKVGADAERFRGLVANRVPIYNVGVKCTHGRSMPIVVSSELLLVPGAKPPYSL